MAEVRDLAAELRFTHKHQEAMREAFGDAELLMVLLGKGDAKVPGVGRKISTQVNGCVIDRAFYRTDELALGILLLFLLRCLSE